MVLIDSVRSSGFAAYDSSSYNNAVFVRSLFTVKNQLKEASTNYDDALFSGGRVVLYNKEIGRLFGLIDKEVVRLSKNSERFNLFGFLSTTDERFVVCRFDEKFFGVRWILDAISQIPPSQIPSFENSDGFADFLKNLILQKVAVSDGFLGGIDSETFFKKRMSVEKSKLLYDSLLRFLVNSVSVPDSSVVVKYYNDNKSEKYLDPKKVVVRQIKVKSKALADSLFVVVSGDPSLFESLAFTFSINRKASGGLMESLKGVNIIF